MENAEEQLYGLMVRAEQNELLWNDRQIVNCNINIIKMEEMCLTLQDLVNTISYMGFRQVEIFIPLPKVIQKIVFSYDEEVFNPRIVYFNYFMQQSIHMETFLHYVRQTPAVRHYIYRRKKAIDVINTITDEVEHRKSEIKSLMPLNVRMYKEYKNRMVMSSKSISNLVMYYLDMDDFTNRNDEYNFTVGVFMEMEEQLGGKEVFFLYKIDFL
jgi:GGDEF domain-containing protein